MTRCNKNLKLNTMNWIKKILGLKAKQQCDIHSVSNLFYCELDGNFAHQRCKEQCNHCKEEWDKMSSN